MVGLGVLDSVDLAKWKRWSEWARLHCGRCDAQCASVEALAKHADSVHPGLPRSYYVVTPA